MQPSSKNSLILNWRIFPLNNLRVSTSLILLGNLYPFFHYSSELGLTRFKQRNFTLWKDIADSQYLQSVKIPLLLLNIQFVN